MERFKSITIILLLAVGLLTSVAEAKSPSLLLQEGLYAEEIQGDLDAAIKIYEQIIADTSADRRCAAEAMYRLGMCYLKKQNEQQAKATFEKLVARFPEQTTIIDKAQPLLDELSYSDPAVLMPPETKIYLEIGSPGRQIETILNMLKGTPLENPLAAIGGGAATDANAPTQKSPADMMAALLNPSMMAEFKKIRGMAVGVTGIRSNNPPLIAVLYPGKSDALRGILLAMLGMAGKQGEPIEGMQTVMIGSEAGAAYDDNVIIIAQPIEQLTWCIKQYKGITQEPTLVSQNKLFARLSPKKREENALTIWLDGAGTYAVMAEQMDEDELRLVDGIADLKSIEEVIAHLSIYQSSIAIEASISLKDGHNCLAYGLVRTPNLSGTGFEAVPSESIALASLALGESESGYPETAQQTVKKLTGLDIGREIFANIEQITLFALPPSATSNESILAKHISPVLPRLGLAVTSHNPQQTRQLFAKLLTLANLVTNTQMNEQSLPPERSTAGKYNIGIYNNQAAYCYMDQAGKSTILALSPDVLQAGLSAIKDGQCVLAAGALQKPLRDLSSDTSKLVMVNLGGAVRSANAHIHRSVDTTQNPTNYPLTQRLEQLAQACDNTSVQLRTDEELNSFNLRFSIDELPRLGGVFGLLMQLPRTTPKNLTAKPIKPKPADAVVVSAEIKPELSWVSGMYAIKHRLYFGTSVDELSLLAEVMSPSYTELPALEKDTVYYWRVDEIQADGSVVAGEVWSFNTSGRLIGRWKFDETDGDIAYDSSGQGRHGTFAGATWAPTSGKLKGALSFDGTDDCYVEIPTTSMTPEAGTIALWARLAETRTGNEGCFFGHTLDPNSGDWSNRIQLYMDNGDTRLDLGLGDAHFRHTDIMTLSTDIWYHIALTWDGDNYAVYVDGVRKATGTYTGLNSLQSMAHIGNAGKITSGRVNRAFHGLIDDVRIYNYALSQAEIATLYKAAAPDLVE